MLAELLHPSADLAGMFIPLEGSLALPSEAPATSQARQTSTPGTSSISARGTGSTSASGAGGELGIPAGGARGVAGEEGQVTLGPGAGDAAGAGVGAGAGVWAAVVDAARTVGVPRLVRLAEVAVRRQLVEDIEHAERVGSLMRRL